MAALPAERRSALDVLRATVRAEVPDATEVISYRIPTFKLGKPLVGYAAFKAHCSFFIMSTDVADAFRDDLAAYDKARATIHFTPAKPLPADLVRKLVRARVQENKRLAPRKRSAGAMAAGAEQS
jgi:uncharacterized protein YdhG (YjbR/CyaY superfamily)